MSCIKCGDCCEFLGAGFTLDELRANPNFLPHDRDFILEHWTAAEKPKRKPNPLMLDRAFEGYHFYRCDLFDQQTRLCKDNENKPLICKSYPTDCNRKREDYISERCGYVSE